VTRTSTDNGQAEKVSPDRQLDSLLEEATDGAGVPVLMRALGDLPVGIGVLRVADLVFVYANRTVRELVPA
jgi:hypothetical protein